MHLARGLRVRSGARQQQSTHLPPAVFMPAILASMRFGESPERGMTSAGDIRMSVAAWTAAGLLGYGILLRVSYGGRIDSDGANSALQAWDLIHGHVLLHGWLLGDATFYAFELPVNGVAELLLGLGPQAAHVASAAAYFIVVALAVALAVSDSRGAARVARSAVTVTVLTVPLLTMLTVSALVEEPDHAGTAAFLLAAALLIDRCRGRWFTAPLVCLLLCAGELSDATVLYVGVPAVVLACLYRMLAARQLRSADAAVAVAAIASGLLAPAIRGLEVHLGGYLMVAPNTEIAPLSQWPGHVPAVWLVIRYLFAAVPRPDTTLVIGSALGMLCLAVAVAGLTRVAWTWQRASAAEQVLALIIVANIGAFLAGRPTPSGAHEIAVVLPCAAVLAARLVPAEIGGRLRGYAAVAVTVLLALVPLSAAASRPNAAPALGPAPGDSESGPTRPLTAWLRAHGYTYGLSSYWSSSVVTLESGGDVNVRAITLVPDGAAPGAHWQVRAPAWEANARWYDPALHDATFVAAFRTGRYRAATYERAFGKPAAIYPVGSTWLVLDYKANLLTRLLPRMPMGKGPKS
jgi:hypothetical protein